MPLYRKRMWAGSLLTILNVLIVKETGLGLLHRAPHSQLLPKNLWLNSHILYEFQVLQHGFVDRKACRQSASCVKLRGVMELIC